MDTLLRIITWNGLLTRGSVSSNHKYNVIMEVIGIGIFSILGAMQLYDGWSGLKGSYYSVIGLVIGFASLNLAIARLCVLVLGDPKHP